MVTRTYCQLKTTIVLYLSINQFIGCKGTIQPKQPSEESNMIQKLQQQCFHVIFFRFPSPVLPLPVIRYNRPILLHRFTGDSSFDYGFFGKFFNINVGKELANFRAPMSNLFTSQHIIFSENMINCLFPNKAQFASILFSNHLQFP